MQCNPDVASFPDNAAREAGCASCMRWPQAAILNTCQINSTRPGDSDFEGSWIQRALLDRSRTPTPQPYQFVQTTWTCCSGIFSRLLRFWRMETLGEKATLRHLRNDCCLSLEAAISFGRFAVTWQGSSDRLHCFRLHTSLRTPKQSSSHSRYEPDPELSPDLRRP